MMAVFKYWRVILIATSTVLLAAFFGLWRYEALSHSKTKDELLRAEFTIKGHEENIKISEKVSHDYQDNIDRLNADIKRLRNRPAKCVTIAPSSIVHSEAGQRPKHGSENGIRSDWLYDFAIEAEEIRIERNSCKDFVNQVWESKD